MQYTLKKPEYIKKKKRIGCGPGSGHGKTSCKGHKGQKARSGAHFKPGFEGGQMPLQRRVPKRGFNNAQFKEEVQIINIKDIARLGIQEVTPEVLYQKGLIKSQLLPVKLLANGDIASAVKVTVDAVSSSAKEKIEKAGGSVSLRS
ncbi:MAG TPA: 50S ribosomal protein L15 [Spirochaetota bacterium]|nr:50S ribosomal protein L15 [Spirochaetota bacterium]HOM09062.1 50S ribosomal protein L15 [Spirochaetota bacterium]HPP48808.1 50S ribosomal protein L15 [Spirochaetota bacterium]